MSDSFVPEPSSAQEPIGIAQPQDLAAFYCDRRAGEFDVEVRITGTVRLTIKATDAADARHQAEDMIEKNEVELYGEDFDDADVTYVRACPAMYLVQRDGREMGVSHLRPDDKPCAPTSEYMASKYLPPADGSASDRVTADAEQSTGRLDTQNPTSKGHHP